MAYTPIDTHVADAVGTLTSAYKGRPYAEGLIAAIAQGVQDLEDAIAQVDSARLLFGNNAVGAQLDVLGSLVGIARGGLPDATYLSLIYGSIAKNSSDTTCARVLTVIGLIYQTSAIYVWDATSPNHSRYQAPAVVQLAVGSPKTDPSLDQSLKRIVSDTLAACVTIETISQFDAAGVFACAGPQTWVRGCSDMNGVGGGALASLI